MTKQEKLIAALTRRAKGNHKVKKKITKIKQKKVTYDWLAQ